MASSESDSEDQTRIQESLAMHLEAYLDDQIDDIKKTKSKKLKKPKKIDSTKCKNENVTSNCHGKTDRKTENVVGKIKELTNAAKRQQLLSNSVKISTNKDSIKKKMTQLIDGSVRTSKKEVEDTSARSDDSDVDDALDNEEHDEGGYGDGSDEEFSDNSDVMDQDLDPDVSKSESSSNKQLDKFKNALGITSKDVRLLQELRDQASQNTSSHIVTTIATLKGNKTRPPPTLVVFDEKRSKKKKIKKSEVAGDQTESDDESQGPSFDLHRARFEVRKFGVSGLRGSEKEAGMVDLLVKLGAKPPKRENTNYKELQEKRIQEMQEAADKRTLDRSLGFKVVNPNKRKRRDRRDRNDVGVADGQIGSYRGGVQVVGNKDIRQVTHKKHRRR